MLTYRELTIRMAQMTQEEGFDPDMPVLLQTKTMLPVEVIASGKACCVGMQRSDDGGVFMGIISDQEHLKREYIQNKLKGFFDRLNGINEEPDSTQEEG